MVDPSNVVLIVNFDQHTRALKTSTERYSNVLAALDDPRLLADLQRLHDKPDHYTVIAYLRNNLNHICFCVVAALHCSGNSTMF